MPDEVSFGRRGLRAMAVGLLVVIGVIVWLAVEVSSQSGTISRLDSENSMRAGALKAATAYGGYISSYSYSDLTSPTSDWAKVEAHSTASFRTKWLQTSNDLTQLIEQYKGTSQGTVQDAAVQSLSGNQAVVLLFIVESVKNLSQSSSTSPVNFLAQMTVVYQGGQWLINDLELISEP